MNIHDLEKAILTGELDDHLRTIKTLIDSRQRSLNPFKSKTVAGLAVGDIVEFNSKVTPKYLVGVQARVVKLNRTRVKVMLDNDVGRFSKGRAINCPTGIIDKVEVTA